MDQRPAEAHPEVRTEAGIVRGRWRPGSAAFLGIPFAEAPVGALRFAAPVPKAPWDGVLDAAEYGATAQRGDPGIVLIPEPSVPGESTLNVNVFTPSPEPGGGLPVLVWIHGGGYVAGSPASPWYDGRAFNRDGVVTVTISYRLGFDGFGWIEDAPPNRGVRDWLLALEWVQRNISAFGGDPSRVTLAGQSAGGGAVLTLLGMEAAQHLFHQVYAMSAVFSDVSPGRAEAFGRARAAEAEVEPVRAGWAALGEDRIVALQKKATAVNVKSLNVTVGDGLPLGPVVDGELVLRPALDSMRAGVGADKPLVLGTADDEFTTAASAPKVANLLRWTPTGFLLGRMGLPRSRRAGYLAANRDVAADGKARLVGRALTDLMFRTTVPRVAAARASAAGDSVAGGSAARDSAAHVSAAPDSAAGGPAARDSVAGSPATSAPAATWAYRFAWPSGRFGCAVHCLDVPFFFDCLDSPETGPLTGPQPPQPLADEVHAAAVAFAVTGDPGWPGYTPAGRMVRVFDVPSRDVPDGYASVRPLLG